MAAAGAATLQVCAWKVGIIFAAPLQSAACSLVIAAIAVPLRLAILVYGALFFRVPSPGARYRIAAVTLGLVLWVATEAGSCTTGFADTNAGEVSRRLVALASTVVVVVAAYAPPRLARERWGAQPVWRGAP